MIRREEVFKIGHIGKPHGLQGEVQFLFTDDVFDRVEADYLVIDMEGILVPFFMESYRFRSDEMALVTFEDIDTEEKARRLSLHDVYFPKSLADADAQLSGWRALAGFQIKDAETHEVLGEVKSVEDSTANVILQVLRPDGTSFAIPASPDLIQAVDTAQRLLTMTVPDGLLDL